MKKDLQAHSRIIYKESCYIQIIMKYNQLANITKERQTHRYGERTSYQWGGGGREV